MTANQLEYWKQVETKRHNRALEEQGLVGLQNQQKQLQLQEYAQAETGRSNRAKELETYRSHLATEANELVRLQEQERTNRASEDIRRSELAEQKRHNEETEYLTSVSDPFRALATTIDKLFGDSGTTPAPGSAALSNLGKATKEIVSNLNEAAIIGHAKMTGTYKPIRSTGVVSNGIKQLPNLSTVVASASKSQPSLNKTPTKLTITPTSTKKVVTTTKKPDVNANNPVKKQPVRLLGSKSR